MRGLAGALAACVCVCRCTITPHTHHHHHTPPFSPASAEQARVPPAAEKACPHTCSCAPAVLPRPCPPSSPSLTLPELSEPAGFLEREIASTQAAGQLFVVASGNSGINLDDVPLYPTSYKVGGRRACMQEGAACGSGAGG